MAQYIALLHKNGGRGYGVMFPIFRVAYRLVTLSTTHCVKPPKHGLCTLTVCVKIS